MKWTDQNHLAYCTNIHPAEDWEDTFRVLRTDVLAVRDRLAAEGTHEGAFAIGLRLSARAAGELLVGERLAEFAAWLEEENCYVFTINGFPYGDFHGTRVKEKVFQPDWTTPERLRYTQDLFRIVAALAPAEIGGSVSTLPGSHKEFAADEELIFKHLEECALFVEALAEECGKDLHLGLEPEPLGHFENTEETIAFFDRLLARVEDPAVIRRRIGLNYDCCHFALEFDECRPSLEALAAAGVRISKVHLSSALKFFPCDASSLAALKQFDEPTYFHQVLLRGKEGIQRVRDLPEFFRALDSGRWHPDTCDEARCHFHVPLFAEAATPLGTTQDFVLEMLAYRRENPSFCHHFEIETYTWAVLPDSLQSDLTGQIVREFQWVLAQD
ncbi:metabolite traffic protein EboE [Roseibacillus ishigakijimensis]|uniref:Metabolite traffic protein EboE n=1 Tax=Roseibacillus ishigakijimensis TaxID=454146 RepID=A0A934RSF3_9BACT|nr:metabolite traffic protein EboE [Roseibacillus ishigakijimensis]MBK1833385.1 metabolite traffic protein EboE [Roseibacillus ishigakijimensis]